MQKFLEQLFLRVIKMIKSEGYKIEINQQCIKKQKNSIMDYYKKNNIKNYVFEFDKNILKLILSSNLSHNKMWSFYYS